MKSKLGKFLALPHDQRKLLTEAVLLIFSAKILLVLLPLKTVMKISLSPKRISKETDEN